MVKLNGVNDATRVYKYPGPNITRLVSESCLAWKAHGSGARIHPVTPKLLLLLVSLGACAYDANFESCTIQCSANTGCPDGLSCGPEGLCRASGTECNSADGGIGTSPSCLNLAATCGAQGTDDCCSTAVQIPGGSYYRSYDAAGDGMYPSMAYPATVNPFVLDKYEVTVGRFRKFVDAGKGTRADPPGTGAGARMLNGMTDQGGWVTAWNVNLPTDRAALTAALKCDASLQTWTDAPGADEELPINCVTWYEAFAFCVWDGGFLPTEAEWNFAATGGDEQRAYPWSIPASTLMIDCSYANYDGCGAHPRGVGASSPKGDGKWGQSDLAGNIWEWALDWYATPYSTTACDGCADLTTNVRRVNRGGGFSFPSSQLRSALRGFEVPTQPYSTLGVRCAR